MKEGTLLIESLKTIWIVITTIWCLAFGIIWNNKDLLNLAVKIAFWMLAISGIILSLHELHILNININWVIR